MASPSNNRPERTIVTSCGILQDGDGRVLLVHRRADRERWPDLWDLPGGEALDDEDVDDTIVRELREELGIEVQSFEFLETVFDVEPVSGRRLACNLYAVHEYAGAPANCAVEEHDALEWVAPTEFAGRGMLSSILRALRLLLGDAGGSAIPFQRVDQRAAWNEMASHYQAHHTIPIDQIHYGPNIPSEDELGLVGDPRGKDVLEVGCGGGQNAIAFKKRGARRVAGIDLSDEQIVYARALAVGEGVEVEFHQGTVEDLGRFGDTSFDIAFSAYCFQYVHDLDRTLREVYRILRPGGRLAFSLDHPLVGMTGEDGVTFERSYFDREADWLWWFPSGAATRMSAIYRSVEELFGALRVPGFVVETVLEPRQGERRAGRWDDPMYTQTQFPTTIIFAARKPDRGSDR